MQMQREIFNGAILVLCVAAIALLGFVQVGCDRSEPDKPESAKQPDRVEEPVVVVDMDPLPTKIPTPENIGTPAEVKLLKLEPPHKGGRPPFSAPKGTVNLASGMSVTSGEFPVIGDLSVITDGEKKSGEGYFVDMGPMLQWVQIDLEQPCTIYAILFWHYHAQVRVYRSVVVQVADDVDFTENVRTLFNNDQDGSANLGAGEDLLYVDTYEGKLVDAKGVKARYVRLYSNGNTTNDSSHYVEVEVFGKPAE